MIESQLQALYDIQNGRQAIMQCRLFHAHGSHLLLDHSGQRRALLVVR